MCVSSRVCVCIGLRLTLWCWSFFKLFIEVGPQQNSEIIITGLSCYPSCSGVTQLYLPRTRNTRLHYYTHLEFILVSGCELQSYSLCVNHFIPKGVSPALMESFKCLVPVLISRENQHVETQGWERTHFANSVGHWNQS